MLFQILVIALSVLSAFFFQEYFLNTHRDEDMITRFVFSMLLWITFQALIVLVIWLLHFPIDLDSLMVANLLLLAVALSFKCISFSHDKK